ncbi:hypothetical protein RB614_27295 [Phytohabitans sp. ZYX-F-186]|uniref:Integral membrane protein n=1 Tax=Phytohabitans maris TaxID=3071409 RepID=A0ABU0ZPB1_9ACTN|nr:hypothetical protein [Phytohabitans sp. ZYX-F-186]MDQ7908237.1 hypothetical protein [Phytohabitans sp. ZYX-F-186]
MTTYPCPVCGAPADLAAGCGGCGRAPDPRAAEVVRLNADLAALAPRLRAALDAYHAVAAEFETTRRRRDELAGRVRQAALQARGPGVPPVVPPPAAPPAAPPATLRPEARPVAVQNLLFVLGGLLVGAAAVVFTGVAWATYGAVGRSVALGVVTLLALAVPPLAARRGLRATAETFAAIAMLLVVLDGYGAWYVDLFGLGAVPGAGYAAGVCAVTAAAGLGYGLATGLTAPRLAALVAIQPVPPLLAAEWHAGVPGWSLAFTAVAVANLAVARAAHREARLAAWTLYGCAQVLSGVCALAALLQPGPLDWPALAGVPALLSAATLLAAARLAGPAPLRGPAAAVATLAAGGAIVRPLAELTPSLLLVTAAATVLSLGIAAHLARPALAREPSPSAPPPTQPASPSAPPGPAAARPDQAAARSEGEARPEPAVARLEGDARPEPAVARSEGEARPESSVAWPGGEAARRGARRPVARGAVARGPEAVGVWVGAVVAVALLAPFAVGMAAVDAVATLVASLPVWRGGSGAGAPFDWQVPVAVALGTAALALAVRPAWRRGVAVWGGAVALLGLPAPWWALLPLELAAAAVLALALSRRMPAVAGPVAAVLAAHGLAVSLVRPWSATATLGALAAIGAAALATGSRPSTAPETAAGVRRPAGGGAASWEGAGGAGRGTAGHQARGAAASRERAGGAGGEAAGVGRRVGGEAASREGAGRGGAGRQAGGDARAGAGASGRGTVRVGRDVGEREGGGAAGRGEDAGGWGGSVRPGRGAEVVRWVAFAVGLVAWPAGAACAVFAAGVEQPWPARAGLAVAALLLLPVAVLGGRPYTVAALAVAVTGATLWPDLAGAGDPTGLYPGLGLLVLAAGYRSVRPAGRVTLAVAASMHTLVLLTVLIPLSYVLLVEPYRWLASVWSGAPDHIGHDLPPGGPAAVLLVAASLALVGRYGAATLTGLFGAVAVAAAAGVPWPVVPAAPLALGTGAVLAVTLRSGGRWYGVPVGCLMAAPGLAGLLPTEAATLAGLGFVVVAAAVVGVAGATAAARTAGWLAGAAAGGAFAIAATLASGLPLARAAYPLLAVAALALGLAALLRPRTASAARPAEGDPPAREAAPRRAQGALPATDAATQPAKGAALAGMGTAGAAGERRRGAERVALDAAAYAVAVLALLLTVADARHAAAVCTLWAAAVAARAVAPGETARRRLALVAGGSVLLAWWLLLTAERVAVTEAYTVPAALLALAAGCLALRARPGIGSWVGYGPGLAVALLPSLASVLVADGQGVRRLLLGLGALLAVLAGAHEKRQAPLVVGGVVLVVVAVHEVLVWDLLPRWAYLAIGGLVLIAVAMTYERRLRDLRRLRGAIARMT